MRLVQMGCEVNTVTNHFKQTPTHSAAFGGHPHCLVWLTQAGADVNKQVRLNDYNEGGPGWVEWLVAVPDPCGQCVEQM